MKKLTLVCSALLLNLSLAGCGNQDNNSEKHSSVKSEKVKSDSSSKKSSSSSKSSSLSMSSSSSVVSSTAQTSSIENTQQPQNTAAANNQQSQTVTQQNQQQTATQQSTQSDQQNQPNNQQQYTEQGHYPTWKEGNVYCAQLPDGTIMRQTFADSNDPGSYQGNLEVQHETAQMQDQWNKEHGIN